MTAIQDKNNFLLQNGLLNLGRPIGSEELLHDGGSKQRFEFGNIYFHPRAGTAFECHGLILQKYVELNEEKSGLGYPITDEINSPAVVGGRTNRFENGALLFDPAIGVTVEFNDDRILIPQVIVKIHDNIPVNLAQGETLSVGQLAAMAGPMGGAPIVAVISSVLPDFVFRRVFDSLSPVELQSIIDQARTQDPGYSPPNFNNFLEIDCPIDFNTQLLVDVLTQWTGVVEHAYTASSPSDPQVVGSSNPFFGQQGYLTAAPNGISVQAAWARGADGNGTRFIDLEQGWFLAHEDLPPNIQLLEGINRRVSFSHGAAVLGEIVGIDNSTGIVGIAPRTFARVISYFHPAERFDSKKSRARVGDMIMKATSALGFGDVLLLEAQFEGKINNRNTFVPVEADPAVFEAIKLATKFGVIVVEAAGNGGSNLDEFRDRSGKKILSRNAPAEFKDSGAIMVGASTSKFPHERVLTVNSLPSASNFGSRIDCHAWGENIVTSGNPQEATKRNGYWNGPKFFGGTSGAAPIIVGMCLLMQNLRLTLRPRSGTSGKLGPFDMRKTLSNPLNGTQSFLVSDQIGTMPDFHKIIANEFD